MASQDLSIVGIEASSRDDANDVADAIDEMAKQGSITVREIAVAHKNKHDRVKVHYITDHGAGIGAIAGAGWGALGLAGAAVGGTVLTGGLLPIVAGSVVGLGVSTGVGAAIGKAFNIHHEGAKDVLKTLADHVQAGGAVTFAVVDPANADVVADAFSDREVHATTVTGEQQDAIADELSED